MAEKEYIEAKDLDDFRNEIMDKFLSLCNYNDYNKLTLLRISETIDEVYEKYVSKPLADVAEVRHGEWEWHTEVHGNPLDGMDEDFGYRCSNCKVWAEEYGVDGDIYEEPPTSILHYCPNCGAKMDGGKT